MRKMEKMFESFSQSLRKRRHSSDADSGSDSESEERNGKRRTEDGEDSSGVLVVEGEKNPDLKNLDECENSFARKKTQDLDNRPAEGSKFREIELQLSEAEKLGPKVSEAISTLLNGRIGEKMEDDAQKAKFVIQNRARKLPQHDCTKSERKPPEEPQRRTEKA